MIDRALASLFVLCLALAAPAAQQPADQGLTQAQLEERIKEARDLQFTAPQSVSAKLAPVLEALRQAAQRGELAGVRAKLLQDALLIEIHTRIMLIGSESETTALLRELLVLNPKLDDSHFNPREKTLAARVRSAEGAQIILRSAPEGAALVYMGEQLATTPIELAVIAGTYRLTLQKEGFVDQTFDVTLKPSEIVTLDRSLRRRNVEVPIAVTAAGVKVRVNGRDAGTTQPYAAWLAALPADRQPAFTAAVESWAAERATASFIRLQDLPLDTPIQLELEAPCYQTLRMSFTVPETEVDFKLPVHVRPELRRLDLKRNYGTVEITSTPAGGEVWIDGTSQGTTPAQKDLCPGPHRIQVFHRSGQYVQDVEVAPGQTTRVTGQVRPALAFLGVYGRTGSSGFAPIEADWTAAARRLAQGLTAFADLKPSQAAVEGLRKNGGLPLEKLLPAPQARAETADLRPALKRVATDVGRADLLLLGERSGDNYVFQLYGTLHNAGDRIELQTLDEPSLDYLVNQLNRAAQVRAHLSAAVLGADVLDSPDGAVVTKVNPASPAARTRLAPGVVVKTVDQKPASAHEFAALLAAKKPGDSVKLESLAGKEALSLSVPLGFAGVEYPWSTPDGFSNSVLVTLNHILELDSLSDEARFAALGLGLGLMRHREWRLALEFLGRASLEVHKSGICGGTVLYYQGRCYEELGDKARAESHYARAKDYPAATLGTADGVAIPVFAERRIQSLKAAP